MQTRSLVWYRGGNELLSFRMYDADGCSLEGKYTCEELDDVPFPAEALEAARLMGGWLNLIPYDQEIHEFDESIAEDMDLFEKVWSRYSGLSVIDFKNPRPTLHEE